MKITDMFVQRLNVKRWTYQFLQCINTDEFVYKITYSSGLNIIVRLNMDEAGLLTSPNIESNIKFEAKLDREILRYVKNLKNDEETNNE